MAVTLTKSYQKISTISLTYGEIRTYAKYTSQDTSTNKTSYSIKSTYYVNSGVTQVHFSSATATLDGTNKSYGDTHMYTGETKIQELTRTLTHNNDGSSPNKTISTSWSATFGGSGSTSATINVPKINRKADITSAPNFNDTDNPVLKYSNPAGNSVSSLQARIENSAGGTAYVDYRNISKTGTSYTFNFTETERNNLIYQARNTNTLAVKFVIKTVIGGTTLYSTVNKNLSIVNANPTETTTFLETNQDVIDLLDSSSADTIIQNVSSVRLTSTPTTLKSATVSKVLFKNGTSESSDTSSPYEVTITPTTNTFTTTATDSRANSITNTYTKTMIEYLPVDITSFSFKRVNPTSSDILLNAEIRYKQTNFGETTNTPTIKWKLGEDGALNTLTASDYTVDTTNDKITITNLLLSNVLLYTQSGVFYLYVNDVLTSDTENLEVTEGIPTFEAGSRDVQINGTLYIADEDRTNKVNVGERISDTGWISVPLASGVQEAQAELGGTYGIKYRKIGNHVFIKGCISLTGGSGAQISATPLPYGPASNVYSFVPLGGSNVARIYVKPDGHIRFEWAKKLSDGSDITGTISWLEIDLDFFTDLPLR